MVWFGFIDETRIAAGRSQSSVSLLASEHQPHSRNLGGSVSRVAQRCKQLFTENYEILFDSIGLR